jgi:hypothetical protein
MWDIITLNHVFEHVSDPSAALSAARERLSENGRAIIRTPTVSSWAWEHFQSNWVGLDPPRHLHIFSRSGLESIASANGLEVELMIDDSSTFQFWGSEMVKQGIPIRSEMGAGARVAASRPGFIREAIRSQRLNAAGRGDSVTMILRRCDTSAPG